MTDDASEHDDNQSRTDTRSDQDRNQHDLASDTRVPSIAPPVCGDQG